MNTEKFVGVRLNGGTFDDYVLEHMRKLIRLEVSSMDKPVTRKILAERLGMDRNRIVRLANALGIIDVFG